MKSIDLNADMGEGFASDLELLSVVTSANLSCGKYTEKGEIDFHLLGAAVKSKVRVGFHPGYPDPDSFGRRRFADLPDDIVSRLKESFEESLRKIPSEARYLKPHGALYHDCLLPGYPRTVVREMLRATKLPLMGMPESEHETLALEAGVPLIREGFVDRRMQPDGRLVPRGHPDAMLHDSREIGEQAVRLAEKCESLCLHGDGDDPVGVARIARAALEGAGFKVSSGMLGTVRVKSSLGPNFWVRSLSTEDELRRFGVPSGHSFYSEFGSISCALLDSEGILELSGPITLEFLIPTAVALYGGAEVTLLNGELIAHPVTRMVPVGGVLELGAPSQAARRWISWAGLESPGLTPRLLRTGDEFLAATPYRRFSPVPGACLSPPRELTFESLVGRVAPMTFTVHHHSSRVGIRLVPASDLTSVPPLATSEPSVPGVIQQTPQGEWIIHGPDGPTISGYPKVGVLDQFELEDASLLRIGDTVVLQPRQTPGRRLSEHGYRSWGAEDSGIPYPAARQAPLSTRAFELPPPPSRGMSVE